MVTGGREDIMVRRAQNSAELRIHSTLDTKHKLSRNSQFKRSKVKIMASDAGTQKNKASHGEVSSGTEPSRNKVMRRKAGLSSSARQSWVSLD